LAGIRLDEAVAAADAGGCPEGSSATVCEEVLAEINEARDKIAKAEEKAAEGKVDQAITAHKQAWSAATRAIGGL